MEVSVSAIFSRFSMFASVEEAEKCEHSIDLLTLVKNGWNVELHRNRSWAPTHCTVRLPPIAIMSFCSNNTEERPYKKTKNEEETIDEQHYKKTFVNDTSPYSKSDVLTGVVLTVNKAGLIEMITSRNVEVTQFVAKHVKQMLRRWLELEVDHWSDQWWEEESSLIYYMSTEKQLLSSERLLENSTSCMTYNDRDASFRVVFFNCILKPSPLELQRLKSKLNAKRCFCNTYNFNNKNENNNVIYHTDMPQLELKRWSTLSPSSLESSAYITETNNTNENRYNWLENKNNVHGASINSHDFRKSHIYKKWGNKRMKSSHNDKCDNFNYSRNKLYVTSETTIRELEHYLQIALSFSASTTQKHSENNNYEENNSSIHNASHEEGGNGKEKSSKLNDIIVDSSFNACVYTISSSSSNNINDTLITSDEGNAKKSTTHKVNTEVIGAKTLEEEEVRNAPTTIHLKKESYGAIVDVNNNNNDGNTNDRDEYLLKKERLLARYLISYKITRLPRRSGIQLNLEWKAHDTPYHYQPNKLDCKINNIDSSNYDDVETESTNINEHTYKHVTHEPELQTQEGHDRTNVQSVSCLIFTSGIVQMTSLSMTTVDNVTRLILLPLLLYHSDFESEFEKSF